MPGESMCADQDIYRFSTMEQNLNTNAEIRLTTLKNWLQGIAATHGLDIATLQAASSDASFRHYYRLQSSAGTAIVMDAPPEHEDCRPFLHVTGLLQQAGLNVPAILAQNTQEGFLLLSDLGRQTYYQATQAGLDDDSLQKIYSDALAALVRLQTAPTTGLPAYDAQRLSQELTVFPRSEEHTSELQSLMRISYAVFRLKKETTP